MSCFLFARLSFWDGFGQVLDFGNTLFIYNESASPAQADYFATKSDWIAVGNDIRYAIKQLELEADRENFVISEQRAQAK